MMKVDRLITTIILVAMLSLMLPFSSAEAQITIYSDRDSFLETTGSCPNGPYPLVGKVNNVYFWNHLGFSSANGIYNYLWVQEWDTNLPGNEIAISGIEDLDVTIDTLTNAAGFYFYDPKNSQTGCPATNSLFSVTLLNGSAVAGTFSFSSLVPPDSPTISFPIFFGIYTDVAFNKIEIRETGGCDNEFFGDFFIQNIGDDDGDNVCENIDNCQDVGNPDQADVDGDGVGDLCDNDMDADGIENAIDNCPYDFNDDQVDSDGDMLGDACDGDDDGDGVLDDVDACFPTVFGEIVDESGCSIAQQCPCEHGLTGNRWKNHGGYVSCVAQVAESFLSKGLISLAEKDAVVSEAAGSSCGYKNR